MIPVLGRLFLTVIANSLFLLFALCSYAVELPTNIPASSVPYLGKHHIDTLNIHDPAILADPITKKYYVYDSYQQGSKYDKLTSASGNSGVQGYWSDDLISWYGPSLVYEINNSSWAQSSPAPWSPEVSFYQGKYYLLTTLHNAKNIMYKPKNSPAVFQRGVQIFVSDSPLGPFKRFTNKAHTPSNEMALDGTLWIEDGQPWLIYCQEWLQVGDGLFKAIRLTADLSDTLGEAITLFSATDARWTENSINYNTYLNQHASIANGPWPYKTKTGRLLLLWTSVNKDRSKAYTTSFAYSSNGKITGQWQQSNIELLAGDRGHGNIFKGFNGKLMLAHHRYFNQPFTRLQIYSIEDTGEQIEIIEQVLGHK